MLSTADSIHDWWSARSALPFYPSMTFLPQGLVLGSSTPLARFKRGRPRPALDVEGKEARILAMLCAAHDRPIAAVTLETIKRAAEEWQHGDKALALIRLAFLDLPRLDPIGAYRLDVAADLLDAGFPPRTAIRELGFPSVLREIAKFDPDQPRVAAGNGRQSGRWTSADQGSAATELPPKPSSHKILVVRFEAKILGATRTDAVPDYLIPGAQYAQLPERPTVSEGTLRHIEKEHWFTSAVPDKGKFTPEYSNDEKIKQLIEDAWQQATPSDIGPGRWRTPRMAIAGAVFRLDLDTHIATPEIIGQSATRRAAPSVPTNTYVVILDSGLNVVTCYPINPLDTINPQNDAR